MTQTPQPTKQAIEDLLSFIQQHDYEQMTAFGGGSAQDDARAKAHIRALEARYERIAAGTPKDGDLAQMRRWVKSWSDQGAFESSTWAALYAWVYGSAPKLDSSGYIQA